jgi:hypothetical protein
MFASLEKLEAAPNARYGDGGAWGKHGSLTRPYKETVTITIVWLGETTVNHAEQAPARAPSSAELSLHADIRSAKLLQQCLHLLSEQLQGFRRWGMIDIGVPLH